MINFEELAQAMGDLDEDTMLKLLDQVTAEGKEAADQAMTACQKGMDTVGELFEQGEYFVGDLIYAGELMTQAAGILKDALAAGESTESTGTKVILCTVKNDLHDIGKNIVKAMMEANGFEVIDLGIDTAPETIVEAVKTHQIKILLLSGVLTLAIGSMKETVDALKAAGLEDVKVLIGGAPVSENARNVTGADEWAQSPQKTIQVCKAWANL